MTVKITKSEIDLRSQIAEQNIPSGPVGRDILNSDTVSEVYNVINPGRRNLIINGKMDIYQRGSSHSTLGYGYHTADRWRSSYNGTTSTIFGNVTETVLTDQEVDGFTVNVLNRYIPTNTDSGKHRFNYRMEESDTKAFIGKPVTLSYYIKADKEIEFDETSIGSLSLPGSYLVTPNWQRITHTFNMPSLNTYADIIIGTTASKLSNANIYITMVQMEPGRVATPFEHRSISEELTLCQRYYHRHIQDAVNYADIATGVAASTSVFFVPYRLPVEMRDKPSLTYSALSNLRITKVFGFSSDISAITIGYNSKNTPALQATASVSITDGAAYMLGYKGDSAGSNGWVAFDAEL